MSNVQGFTLVSGEIIVASVENQDEDTLSVTSPAQIILQQMDHERMGISMIPYLPFSVNKLTFTQHAIASYFDVNTQILNEYNRLYGSGIQIADASQVPKIAS